VLAHNTTPESSTGIAALTCVHFSTQTANRQNRLAVFFIRGFGVSRCYPTYLPQPTTRKE
jgi:hypothetical protein